MKANLHCRREAAQLFRACLVGGLVDEGRARQAVQTIISDKSRNRLGTLSHFRHLVMGNRAQHAAVIESAKPLPAELQGRVKAGLQRVYGAGLCESFIENPALIAGMRIRVGSDVYDGSIRARLAALEKAFNVGKQLR